MMLMATRRRWPCGRAHGEGKGTRRLRRLLARLALRHQFARVLTDAYTSFGVKCIIAPGIPNNAGSLES
jgi:hypothetical protein